MAEDSEEVKTFKDLGLSEPLVEACERLGWKNPQKIQAEAIPLALEGWCFDEILRNVIHENMIFRNIIKIVYLLKIFLGIFYAISVIFLLFMSLV